MIDGLLFILTFSSAIGCGLIAGVFFAFSAFVMKALARLPHQQGIAAMQSINIAVINHVFFIVFFGTALICVVLAVGSILVWPEPGAYYLLAGCVFYLAGVIFVTMMFNVPLNNMLAGVEPTGAKSVGAWQGYLARWTAWNHVRTAMSICAMSLFIMALR